MHFCCQPGYLWWCSVWDSTSAGQCSSGCVTNPRTATLEQATTRDLMSGLLHQDQQVPDHASTTACSRHMPELSAPSCCLAFKPGRRTGMGSGEVTTQDSTVKVSAGERSGEHGGRAIGALAYYASKRGIKGVWLPCRNPDQHVTCGVYVVTERQFVVNGLLCIPACLWKKGASERCRGPIEMAEEQEIQWDWTVHLQICAPSVLVSFWAMLHFAPRSAEPSRKEGCWWGASA